MSGSESGGDGPVRFSETKRHEQEKRKRVEVRVYGLRVGSVEEGGRQTALWPKVAKERSQKGAPTPCMAVYTIC
eukprot:2800498-Rhodomonas_salina.2